MASQETFGNGAVLNSQYQLQTGQLTQLAYAQGASGLRKLGYGYDVFGNLKRQSLNDGASREDYSYDSLQRLVTAIRSGAASGTVNYGYDSVGNFTKKSDFSTNTAGAYGYTGGSCGGGANAVKSVQLAAGGTRTYCYDANGNLTGDNAGLAIQYDHQNLTVKATRGSQTDEFRYGPDGQRTRSWGSDGSRIYLLGYEVRTDTGETKVYVGDYAVITRTASTRKVEYLLKDRLGSVDAVASSAGVVTETRGYDAFGKPRSGTWADLSPAKLGSTSVTPKGFTQHEHLNQLELIHMNGRVYDYALGRFFGVDPFIQFPLNSQSLNPYSYILNNPLSGKDPSGYATCDAGADVKSCAASATQGGGTAKVYQQEAGSRIKTTVGTASVGKGGNLTLTNSANGRSVTITGMGNGADRGMGKTGSSADGRREQSVSASSKGAERARSASCGVASDTAGRERQWLQPATPGEVEELKDNIEAEDDRWDQRGLTAKEMKAVRSVHPDLDVSVIRVGYFESGQGAITPRNTMWFPRNAFKGGPCDDFTACNGGRYVGWFIHEVSHVWQYQRGVSPVLGHIFSIDAVQFGNYFSRRQYFLTPSPALLSTEQQADWYMHDYLVKRGR